MHDCIVWHSSLVDSFVNVTDVTHNLSRGSDGYTIFNSPVTPETLPTFLSLQRSQLPALPVLEKNLDDYDGYQRDFTERRRPPSTFNSTNASFAVRGKKIASR